MSGGHCSSDRPFSLGWTSLVAGHHDQAAATRPVGEAKYQPSFQVFDDRAGHDECGWQTVKVEARRCTSATSAREWAQIPGLLMNFVAVVVVVDILLTGQLMADNDMRYNIMFQLFAATVLCHTSQVGETMDSHQIGTHRPRYKMHALLDCPHCSCPLLNTGY